jgi:hypothetical protein
VDIPSGVGNERIMAQIGPGPARDVVASLLADSPLDFIILGSAAPGGIASIMLTPTQAGPASGTPTQAAVNRAPTPPPEDESEAEPEPIPPPMPPQQAPVEPGQVVPGTVGQPPNMETQPQPQAQPGGASQVKTPEQLLQELQRMQQQQQQQQQQPQGPRRTPQPQEQL